MVFDANGCDSTGVDVVSPSLAHGGRFKFRVPRFVHCSGHIQHEDTFIWSASRSSRNFVTVFSSAAGTKNQSESVSGCFSLRLSSMINRSYYDHPFWREFGWTGEELSRSIVVSRTVKQPSIVDN